MQQEGGKKATGWPSVDTLPTVGVTSASPSIEGAPSCSLTASAVPTNTTNSPARHELFRISKMQKRSNRIDCFATMYAEDLDRESSFKYIL